MATDRDAPPPAAQDPAPPGPPVPPPSTAQTLVAGGVDPTATPLALRPVSAPDGPEAVAPVSGPPCRILEDLQARLRASGDIRSGAERIPRASLSVSEAILLWNGQWIDETSVGGMAVLRPIEEAVAAAVRQAPLACRIAVVHGPRLITLGDAGGAKIFAFGSGAWTWAAILDDLNARGVK